MWWPLKEENDKDVRRIEQVIPATVTKLQFIKFIPVVFEISNIVLSLCSIFASSFVYILLELIRYFHNHIIISSLSAFSWH